MDGAFAKVVQKTLNRTKAKVLQNLGKADKTTDGKFEDHVTNFATQQTAAMKLQKEVKHYINCIKVMTTASKSLYTVIRETYEEEWVDVHTVDSVIRSLDMLYTNYEAELVERVNADLQSYVELFNPMKEKINKRKRKLLDYDNAKHSWESARGAKKPDDFKIAKAEESMQETERLYNELNAELHRELPKFYSYRIDFIASNLSRLYSTESTFHTETGKLTEQLYQLMEQIPKAEQRDGNKSTTQSSTTPRSTTQTTKLDSPITYSKHDTPTTPEDDDDHYNDIDDYQDESKQRPRSDDAYMDNSNTQPGDIEVHETNRQTDNDQPGLYLELSERNSRTRASTVSETYLEPAPTESQRAASSQSNNKLAMSIQNGDTVGGDNDGSHGGDNPTQSNTDSNSEDAHILAESSVPTEYDMAAEPANTNTVSGGDNRIVSGENYSTIEDEYEREAVYQNIDTATQQSESAVSKSQSTTQVLATHTYTAEDEDELSFEAGEIIDIIEFDDEEDKDEGWLMGISTKSGRKGLFPENFTRKIIKRNSTKQES